jgi:DNA-binding MarR family transcriptional regulator
MEGAGAEQIAVVLQAAAVLLVRYLSNGQGQSLTSSLVLARVHDDGPVRISALAAESGVSQPSMTELVGRLERDGLVTRLSDPQDGRATLVGITASGRTQRSQSRRTIHDRLVELLEMLPAEDQATLNLAMRVSSPFIQQLTQFAAQHTAGDRALSTT